MPTQNECRQIILKELTAGVNRGMHLIRNEAVLNVSGRVLKRRTGRLASSIRTDIRSTRSGLIGSVGTNVFYGRIWEVTGRRAVTIVPRHKKVLRFVARDGTVVFTKRAVIPAQKPRPFLRPAVDAMLPEIREDIADRMVKAIGDCFDRRIVVKA